MAGHAILVVLAVALSKTVTAQLFPFSSLRSYIDQHHAESADQSTKAPPPVDDYRYLQEAETRFIPSAPGFDHSQTERTVIVTPKPKYTPQRLVPEPSEDPNSPNIPSIGFGSAVGNGIFQSVSGPSESEQSPLSSVVTPVRSVIIEKPSKGIGQKTKFDPILLKESPSKTHYVEKTVVDSIPSLSVMIPPDSYKKKTGGLIDYLVPPKFPSVYETHMKGISPSPSNLLDVNAVEDSKLTTALPVKTTKKRKKNKNKGKSDTSIAGSEKRYRVRSRVPTLSKEPSVEIHSAGSEVYVRPPQSYRPPQSHRPQHISSTPHPIEEQIAAETNFGLGGGGGGERVEFQVHGQSGPESYKFGFDTGDGKNRHFRYEEKDHTGDVKGHYGYYDKSGKLQVVNYHADKHGFHASSP